MSQRNQSTVPPLLRFLAVNAAIGIAAGVLLAAALMLLNIGGLGTLIIESGSPITAIVLLSGAFALTFGSLAMGSAIMLLPRQD